MVLSGFGCFFQPFHSHHSSTQTHDGQQLNHYVLHFFTASASLGGFSCVGLEPSFKHLARGDRHLDELNLFVR